ncbi:hypothetical protein ACRAWD_06995 [Caulobacter segnis]
MPSFYAETTTGRIFPRFYIRGLGNIDFYLGLTLAVSIIQDDVVLEHVVLKSNPLFDIGQISAARSAGLAVRPQHHRRHRQGSTPSSPAKSIEAASRPHYSTDGTTTVDGGVGGPIADGLMFPRLGAVPAPRRLRGQHLFGPQRRRRTMTAREERPGRLHRKGRPPARSWPSRTTSCRSWSGPRPQLFGHLDPVPAPGPDQGQQQAQRPA